MDADRLKRTIRKITYKDWTFDVVSGTGGDLSVAVQMPAYDVNEKKAVAVVVRSNCVVLRTDTEAQVVERIYVTVVNMEQHEASELFDFNDKRPFNEHRPVLGTPRPTTLIPPDDGPRRPIGCSMGSTGRAALERLSKLSRRSLSQTLALAFEIAMVLNPLVMEKLVINPSPVKALRLK